MRNKDIKLDKEKERDEKEKSKNPDLQHTRLCWILLLLCVGRWPAIL